VIVTLAVDTGFKYLSVAPYAGWWCPRPGPPRDRAGVERHRGLERILRVPVSRRSRTPCSRSTRPPRWASLCRW